MEPERGFSSPGIGASAAAAVRVVWIPSVGAGVAQPELFDRLILGTMLGGGLLWLMQGGGGRESDA